MLGFHTQPQALAGTEPAFRQVRLTACVQSLIRALELLADDAPTTAPTAAPTAGTTATSPTGKAVAAAAGGLASGVGFSAAGAAHAASAHLALALTCHRMCEEGLGLDPDAKKLVARVNGSGACRS